MVILIEPQLLSLKLGAKDYIAKPFQTEVFLSRIRAVIDSGLSTILVVTEDSLVLKLLTEALGRVGYKALTSPSGEKALEIISDGKIDGIISELALVDMTGLDLLSSAQELRPAIPALFISDSQINITENDIVDAGGDGLIHRPFNTTEIARKASQLIFANG